MGRSYLALLSLPCCVESRNVYPLQSSANVILLFVFFYIVKLQRFLFMQEPKSRLNTGQPNTPGSPTVATTINAFMCCFHLITIWCEPFSCDLRSLSPILNGNGIIQPKISGDLGILQFFSPLSSLRSQ